jgi:hypothetical protein
LKRFAPLIVLGLIVTPILALASESSETSTSKDRREFISCEFLNRETNVYLGNANDWLRGDSKEFDLTPIALDSLGIKVTHAGDVESVDLRVKNKVTKKILFETKGENFRNGKTFDFEIPNSDDGSRVQAFCISYER